MVTPNVAWIVTSYSVRRYAVLSHELRSNVNKNLTLSLLNVLTKLNLLLAYTYENVIYVGPLLNDLSDAWQMSHS